MLGCGMLHNTPVDVHTQKTKPTVCDQTVIVMVVGNRCLFRFW